jgi:hypothetical protein
MPWPDCAAAARVLREIRFCLEASDIEARLRKLEEAAGADPTWPGHPSQNGDARRLDALIRSGSGP